MGVRDAGGRRGAGGECVRKQTDQACMPSLVLTVHLSASPCRPIHSPDHACARARAPSLSPPQLGTGQLTFKRLLQRLFPEATPKDIKVLMHMADPTACMPQAKPDLSVRVPASRTPERESQRLGGVGACSVGLPRPLTSPRRPLPASPRIASLLLLPPAVVRRGP